MVCKCLSLNVLVFHLEFDINNFFHLIFLMVTGSWNPLSSHCSIKKNKLLKTHSSCFLCKWRRVKSFLLIYEMFWQQEIKNR